MDNEHVTYRKACIQKSWTQTEHKRRKSKKVKGIADKNQAITYARSETTGVARARAYTHSHAHVVESTKN